MNLDETYEKWKCKKIEPQETQTITQRVKAAQLKWKWWYMILMIFTKHQLFFSSSSRINVCWRHGFGMYRFRTIFYMLRSRYHYYYWFCFFILDSIALFPYRAPIFYFHIKLMQWDCVNFTVCVLCIIQYSIFMTIRSERETQYPKFVHFSLKNPVRFDRWKKSLNTQCSIFPT